MKLNSFKPIKNVKHLLYVLPLIGISIGLFQNCSQNQFALSSSLGSAGPNQSFSISAPVVNLSQDIPALITQSSLSASFSIDGDTDHSVKSVTCELDGPNNMQIVKDCAALSVSFANLTDGDYSLTVMLDSTVVALQPKTSGDLFTLKKVFRKDNTAPVLNVSSTPSSTTSATSAQFVFTATDNLSGVQSILCSLDGASFSACASGAMFTVGLGSHTYQIKATDKAGNTSAVYAYTWSVTSGSLASITLTQNQTSPTKSGSIIFTFSSSASGSTYQCAVDGANYASCTSPKTVTVATGSHSFSVKGLDTSGVSSSISTFNWIVDQTAPALPSILSNLVSPSKSTQVSYTFSSTDANGIASYQCSQDGTTYATCSSPKSYTLTDGTKSFYVKALDQAGNVSTAAKLDLVIDTTAPVVTISSTPSTADLSGSIAFSTVESGSGVSKTQCSLDNAAFSSCTSPAPYSVAIGSHNFRVQVTDLAGNTSNIATVSWAVNTQPPPPPSNGAPLVLYTDALTGPTSGGENNLGAYLSIFGKNFGSDLSAVKVYIGNSEVANYRYLGLSKIGSKFGIQQITVQVGNLGGAALGTALPVKVVVGGVGSNTDNTFMPCAGRILFVSLSGNDSTAVVNDINHPWRHLQVFTGSNNTLAASAYLSMQAGDHIVIRGGNWTDAITTVSAGWADWLRFAGIGNNNGQERNGKANAWIHFTAYPGPINGNAIEDVHHTGQANMGAAFAGPQRSASGTSGNYISISNLHLDVAGGASRDAAPINFQAVQGPWRVINNDLGPWVAGSSTVLNAGAIAGHGQGHKILGNYLHDIEGLLSGDQQLQNHGIYADTSAENWEVGYNYLHNLVGGSGIQFNDNCDGDACAGSYQLPNGQGTWPGFVGIRIHHNWIETTAKYGINFNDQYSVKAGSYEAQAWNNVIIGTRLPPIRINSTQPHQNLSFFYNTLYDCMTTNSGSGNAYVNNEAWGNGPGYVVQNLFENNIFAFGPHTTAGTDFVNYIGVGVFNGVDYGGNTTTYKSSGNLYFANGQSGAQTLANLGDTTGLMADPQFTNVTAGDFSLKSTSPGLNRAIAGQIVGNTVTNDFFLNSRDQVTPDVGAFEHAP